MEPGHKGPVPGAAFILARGRFSAVYPLHLSDVWLPSPLPSPFPSQPSISPLLPPGSSSPPRLSRPRRTAGWRSGCGSCASWRRSGCDGPRLRLRTTTAGKFGIFFRGRNAVGVPFVRLLPAPCMCTCGLLTPTSVHINYCVCGAPPLVAEMWPRKHRQSQRSFGLKHLIDFQPFESFKRVYFLSFLGGGISPLRGLKQPPVEPPTGQTEGRRWLWDSVSQRCKNRP